MHIGVYVVTQCITIYIIIINIILEYVRAPIARRISSYSQIPMMILLHRAADTQTAASTHTPQHKEIFFTLFLVVIVLGNSTQNFVRIVVFLNFEQF